MIMTVRKIGNSRGVIIPAAILEACGIHSEVDLQIQNRTLIMTPPRTNRQGWFDEVAEHDPAYELAKEWDGLNSDDVSGDWQW